MVASVGRLANLFRLQKYIIALLFVSFLCGMILGITLVTDSDFSGGILGSSRSDRSKEQIRHSASSHSKSQRGNNKREQESLLDRLKAKHDNMVNGQEHRDTHDFNPPTGINVANWTAFAERKRKRVESRGRVDVVNHDKTEAVLGDKYPKPNYNVHIFYYPWYGNPETDGKYFHWNHPYLQHWDKNEAKKWPRGRHQPPDDVGSNYYPELGPYSSKAVEVMEEHMKQIRSAGVGM